MALEGREAEIPPHQDIVRPGELTDFSCLVVSGMAARFGQLPDGLRQITAVYIPGDMCDLYSLMLPKVEWALQALSARLTIIRVPHQQLKDLVQAYPAVAEAFWRDCVADASILSQWVVNVGRRDARKRTAHLFCELSLRIEQAGLGSRHSFQVLAIQSQLADALGMTPVHMNRVMRALRQDNLLIVQGRDVQVPDWDALAAVGGFEGGYLEMNQSWRQAH
ncbi:Crp/Fnr family transcriptional regulator [Sphingobium sp. C100]|uniref:Crp/Fnr family transcriptional regulator n=1 Tax=Sphingobium sp. C100 TaxID=1207055 RepID=UPI001F283377|nr:Crp/Fnr family transcriptional regulator [Sphingobium sp. C100]